MSDFELNDGTEDIFGKTSSADLDSQLSFKPWHRPRKQWVRSCQWVNQVNSLLDGTSYSEMETINYFGFPGADCLDIRVLGKAVHQLGKSLCFYGLESTKEASARAQLVTDSILHDLPFIDKTSKIEPSSNFEMLKHSDSKLAQEVRDREPFHVINLDFVDSILSPRVWEDRMDALLRLLTYQFERQYKPWLLFITTRCDQSSVCKDALKNYASVLEGNISSHVSFKEKLYSEILELEEGVEWTAESLLGQEQSFEKVFLLTLLKWILKNSVEKRVALNLHSVAEYKVKDQGEKADMFSLVIEFKKKDVPTDVTGVNGGEPPDINELDIALRLIDRTASPKHVDQLLAGNETLKDRMVTEAKALLDAVGYDVSSYPFSD